MLRWGPVSVCPRTAASCLRVGCVVRGDRGRVRVWDHAKSIIIHPFFIQPHLRKAYARPTYSWSPTLLYLGYITDGLTLNMYMSLLCKLEYCTLCLSACASHSRQNLAGAPSVHAGRRRCAFAAPPPRGFPTSATGRPRALDEPDAAPRAETGREPAEWGARAVCGELVSSRGAAAGSAPGRGATDAA